MYKRGQTSSLFQHALAGRCIHSSNICFVYNYFFTHTHSHPEAPSIIPDSPDGLKFRVKERFPSLFSVWQCPWGKEVELVE